MKKLILLLSVLVTATLGAKGQASDYSTVELGLKGGANMTKIGGESFNDAYRLNYSLGAFLQLNFSKSVGIQPELNFSQVSATTSSNFNALYGDFGPAITNNPHLNYMSIPVLLNLGGRVFKIQVGPQYSILMNSGQSLWTNGKQAFTNGDFGLDGGVWLDLPFHLNAFARYIIGLNNINDVDSQDSWKSQQIQIGVGLRL